jgi:lactoylglutathione lyase
MIRVVDIDKTIAFFNLLGLEEQKRVDNERRATRRRRSN